MKQILVILFLLVSLKTVSQPVFVITTGGDLYSINIVNCTSRHISSTGLGYADIAFTPDGVLWGFVDSNIYIIDTVTGNFTLLGNTGIDAISLVAFNDSTLLVESDLKLYGIRTNDASSFYIDTIGYWALGDLTWYDNDLYLTTSFRLIKIELNASGTDIISVTEVNSISMPTINSEGAATSGFVGDYNSIIGFSGRTASKICQLDGTFQILCDSLTLDNIAGGASIRLPSQVPEPITCHLETAVTDFYSKNDVLEVYPNPVAKYGRIQIKLNDKCGFPLRVDIMSIEGSILLSRTEKSSTGTIEIDLNKQDLTSGLFVISVRSPSQQQHSIIMIE